MAVLPRPLHDERAGEYWQERTSRRLDPHRHRRLGEWQYRSCTSDELDDAYQTKMHNTM
jgi:hypothetical protein